MSARLAEIARQTVTIAESGRYRNDAASLVEIINEFLLSRNRPAVHQEILAKL